MNISRRDFLKLGTCGMAAVAVGAAGGYGLLWRGSEAMAASQTLNLTILEAEHEMTDGVRVAAWAFSLNGTVASVPGVVIYAVEGDDLEINVTNGHSANHSFAVPGVVDSGIIAPGQTVPVQFQAPAAGTYMYLDPLNAPVNRVMGLHGALVVLPRIPLTPYGNPTSTVQRLFGDFGTAEHFPGYPWDPNRTWIWVFGSVDPVKHALAAATPSVAAETFTSGYSPRYFMINGKSGFFASHDHRVEISGYVGQPALIRSMNAGLSWHSPHTHFNHCYRLAVNGVVQRNLWLLDTWSLGPLDRVDMLMPFIQPPDIPPPDLEQDRRRHQPGESSHGLAHALPPGDLPDRCRRQLSQRTHRPHEAPGTGQSGQRGDYRREGGTAGPDRQAQSGRTGIGQFPVDVLRRGTGRRPGDRNRHGSLQRPLGLRGEGAQGPCQSHGQRGFLQHCPAGEHPVHGSLSLPAPRETQRDTRTLCQGGRYNGRTTHSP